MLVNVVFFSDGSSVLVNVVFFSDGSGGLVLGVFALLRLMHSSIMTTRRITVINVMIPSAPISPRSITVRLSGSVLI